MLGKYSALKNRWEIERTSAHTIETKLWKLLYSQLTKQAKKNHFRPNYIIYFSQTNSNTEIN